jgi:hypothetical protein
VRPGRRRTSQVVTTRGEQPAWLASAHRRSRATSACLSGDVGEQETSPALAHDQRDAQRASRQSKRWGTGGSWWSSVTGVPCVWPMDAPATGSIQNPSARSIPVGKVQNRRPTPGSHVSGCPPCDPPHRGNTTHDRRPDALGHPAAGRENQQIQILTANHKAGRRTAALPTRPWKASYGARPRALVGGTPSHFKNDRVQQPPPPFFAIANASREEPTGND